MKEKSSLTLFAQLHPKSPVSEAYRTVRTNVHFSDVQGTLKAIMVTSPGPEDGKSTTVANLAVTMAQSGKKVLVMDCDLRKPVQHKVFELGNAKGVTNVLVEGEPLDGVIQSTAVEGLQVLTSGPIPPNPSELLDSDRMKGLLPSLRSQFDAVLIDAPPVLSVTDAVVLSSRVDGVILVIRAGHTRIDIARDTKEMLLKAKARLLGVVLNEVSYATDGYRYYYYYGGYYGSKSDSL